ncbi:hypothetical protein HPP92_013311 [Vanilla planifolia]|uniref:Uncharacterized protein n=1 Tax=Vanilla planifolia TaxID=51239 RepID=A0A835R1Q0_VANPL|nr:hypothetical protein HPP92_013311 [Vanilla planifolia]
MLINIVVPKRLNTTLWAHKTCEPARPFGFNLELNKASSDRAPWFTVAADKMIQALSEQPSIPETMNTSEVTVMDPTFGDDKGNSHYDSGS